MNDERHEEDGPVSGELMGEGAGLEEEEELEDGDEDEEEELL